ncbi:PepSY-associated TM helix domain-containing protein [Pusillimonas sp.]|uniref:PepSY-associated TM helix domain-containing protein n=1 Tax=Pusillimonas sp. TaxID=3040095 RepID=UPI0037C8E28B
MNGLGLRQANSWLHTWSGLLLGWLLYAVFFTGALSFFRDEISFWMQPDQHASAAHAEAPQRAVEAMHSMAPDASLWTITLPGPRNPTIQARWFEQGERRSKFGGQRAVLDGTTARPLPVRESRGGDFLYRFHFELYGMPRVAARWIVGIATMMMLVAIISGIITHKKIFADFFTFRPRKGQRSWMDAHNVLAVLALPFHLMITYSGLLLLMFMLMPWGVDSAYGGDRQTFFSERGNRAVAGAQTPATEKVPAPLTAIAPLVRQARDRWPGGLEQITVTDPGTSHAIVELRERGASSLLDRGRSERLLFDGVNGTPLESPEQAGPDAFSAIYNVFSSLHLLRFADTWLRWLFFVGGVLGSAMIASGMILWVVKRLPQRRKHGSHLGHRMVEGLNVASLAGLPVAISAYFWANRLLPVSIQARADSEILVFFLGWAACLIHAFLRPHRKAWREQLSILALLLALLPLYDLLQGAGRLSVALSNGSWVAAGMDLTLLGFAALAVAGVYFMRAGRQKPVRRPSRSAEGIEGAAP